MIKRAERIRPIGGFGIDRVAAAAEETGGRHGGPILRMENLDTDLPLPPEALEMTRARLDDPRSNSWLPFTGDLDLRAAISDFTADVASAQAAGRLSDERAAQIRAVRQRVSEDLQLIRLSGPTPSPATTKQPPRQLRLMTTAARTAGATATAAGPPKMHQGEDGGGEHKGKSKG